MQIGDSQLLAVKSLNLDTHENLFKEQDLIYLLNGDISDYTNNSNDIFVQNVPSNKSCYSRPEGFNYNGAIKLDKEQFLLFYTSESTTRITILDTVTCASTSLPDIYCFDFKPENLIRGVYKYSKACEGRSVYFTDGVGPTYVLNIDECLPKKRLTDCQECADEYSDETDCDSLLLNKHVSIPCVTIKESSYGNLPNGVYQIAIALTSEGQRYTDYYIYPTQIKVHSNNGFKFGIDVKFTDCFTEGFDEYELVLISHRTDRGTLAQRIGFYNTSQTAIHISDLDETRFVPLSNEVLYEAKTYYKSAKHITTNSEMLILADLQEETYFDYQPQANKIKSKWQVIKVKAKDAHKYPTFLRDEVYPFDIRFFRRSGARTEWTHIPSNAIETTTATELDFVPASFDLFDPTQSCGAMTPKYWEIYNTAKVILTNNITCADIDNCDYKVVMEGNFAYWESQLLYPDTSVWEADELNCKGLRYHKFPDNRITHIHDDVQCNEEECVNILTVVFDNIERPKDCKGNYLDDIIGYEIGYGDRTNNRSILHKGLLFNMFGENLSNNTESLYSNYPFNDLHPDKFLSEQGRVRDEISIGGIGIDITNNFTPVDTVKHDTFTYHSPDIHYINSDNSATEVKIYTEEIGKVDGKYNDVFEYPKYTLLSDFGNSIAVVVGMWEADMLMKGEKITETVTEHVCNKFKEHVTEVTSYPVPILNGSSFAQWTPLEGSSFDQWNTEIVQDGYTETTQADPPCGNLYADCLTDITIDQNGEFINLPFTLDYTHCTLNFNFGPCSVPDGVIITFKINEQVRSITVKDNEAQYHATLDECEWLTQRDTNGNGIGGETTDVTQALLDVQNTVTFSPDCDCPGDEQTTTSTKTIHKDSIFDHIKDMDWFERYPVLAMHYLEHVGRVKNILKNIIGPSNYAIQYDAVANYDGYDVGNTDIGNHRRKIINSQYLLPVKQYADNIKINNWQRESSLFMKLSFPFSPPTNIDTTRVRYEDIRDNNCKREFHRCSFTKQDEPIQAVSYYAAHKVYSPEQYGSLRDYNVIQLSPCPHKLTDNFNSTGTLIGGDTYITKFSVHRKHPFFDKLPLGTVNDSEFNLSEFYNIWNPRYWMDVNGDSSVEDVFKQMFILGQLFREYNLEDFVEWGNCPNDICDAAGLAAGGLAIAGLIKKYGTVQGLIKSLLLANGAVEVGKFICELISGGVYNPLRLQGKFYTNVNGIAHFWVESSFINDFREYDDTPQSRYYPIEDRDDLTRSDKVPYPEKFLYNLQYLATPVSSISPHRGPKVTCCDLPCNSSSLKAVFSLPNDIESNADRWQIFKPLNYTQFSKSDGTFTGIHRVDDYNILFVFENALYITQAQDGLLSTNGNEIYLGAGDVFRRRLKKLSDETGTGGSVDLLSFINTPYGTFYIDRKRKRVFQITNNRIEITGKLRSWFYRYLPDATPDYTNSIVGSYDPLTDNVYFTLKEDSCNWTISYKPKAESWISFHSFLPDYYIPSSNNLISIKNGGVWTHNDRSSFQTYYGKLYPFTVGISVHKNFQQTEFQSFELYSEFIEQLDYNKKIYNPNVFFNKMFVHNNFCSTGLKHLFVKDRNNDKHALLQATNTDLAEVTSLQDGTYRINKLNNVAIGQPLICNDCDGVGYQILNVDHSKAEKGLMRGKHFNIYLTQDLTGKYKILTQLTVELLKEDKL